MIILAIDQGTSATKAVVWCQARGILSEVDVPVRGLTFTVDCIEQDPELLIESVIKAGRATIEQSGARIDAVGLGNQGETVLAWDRATGTALTPALSWQDRRAHVITDGFSPQLRDELWSTTGLPVDPYFAAPKMTWLKRNYQLPTDAVISTIDAFVNYRLTGRYATDFSTASRTQLLDPRTLRWSTTACNAYEIDPDSLPELLPCDAQVGTTEVFGGSLPVVGLMVDQQAALFAEGCDVRGLAKCTYGTGAFLLANVGAAHPRSTAGLATSLAWVFADGTRASCIDGQVYSAGAGVSWLGRVGFIKDPIDLDILAMSVPDSAGVAFEPAFAGRGAPVWDPAKRAQITGLSLSTTSAHIVHAFLTGLAAEITALARAVEIDLGGPLKVLRVDGGLTNSEVLMQLQADGLGLPVEVYPHTCATALGVAAATLRGFAGPGAEAEITAGWQPSRTFHPKQR